MWAYQALRVGCAKIGQRLGFWRFVIMSLGCVGHQGMECVIHTCSAARVESRQKSNVCI
jgi:hypothetical protein